MQVGIYYQDRDPAQRLILVHNERVETAQAKLDRYNGTRTNPPKGRYVVGPWIDFLNGPAWQGLELPSYTDG